MLTRNKAKKTCFEISPNRSISIKFNTIAKIEKTEMTCDVIKIFRYRFFAFYFLHQP